MRTDTPSRPSSGARAVAGLVIATVLLVGGWMAYDAVESSRIAEALAPYRDTGLPAAADSVDPRLTALGARVFRRRCSACHSITSEARSGPNLFGVTLRRDLGWIRSMMLRPDSMIAHDPVARALREAYGVQMRVSVSEVEARAVLEFLRQVDDQG